MLRSCLHENPSDEFRVASRYEHKLQLASILFYHLFELLTAHELAPAFFVLEDQKVALALVLLIKVSSNFLFCVKDTVSTEVHPNGVFGENFLNTVYRALALRNIDLDLGGADALSNFDEFF